MTIKVQLKREVDGVMQQVNPITSEECVILSDGKKLNEVIDFATTAEDFVDEAIVIEENLVDRVESIENRIVSEFEEQNSQIATGLSNIKTIEQNISNKVDTEVAKVNAQLSRTTDNLQGQINNLVIDGTGDSNPEVVQARGTFKVLNDRLNYNSIDRIVEVSPNILNPDECTENGSVGWNNDFGTYDIRLTTTESNYCISKMFEVNEGEVYIFNHPGNQTNIYLAGENFKLNENNRKTLESNTPFTIPAGINYMRYRFTINGDAMKDGQWRNKVMLCKGSSLPINYTYPNAMVLNNEISIPQLSNYPSKNEVISMIKIDKRTTTPDREKMIVIPSFDGMDKNTFDTVLPYMKEKGLPFTIFSGGTSDNEMIAKFQSVVDYGGEMQFYNGQPALTYEGTDNYIEQYEQFKTNYDNYLKMGVGTPLFVAYSGGRHTHITETISKQMGFKWARTTASDYNVPVKWNDDLFNTPAFFMHNTNYSTMLNISSWDIENKMIRPFLNHCILSDTVTDTSYNIEWENLKKVLDNLYELKENGSIFVMNYSQAYEYLRFPKNCDIGQHVLVYESDGNQHEYVLTNKGWKELT